MGEQHGDVHWTELNTANAAKAAAFYEGLLGWQIAEMPMPDGSTYRIGQRGEEMLAGIFEMSGPEFEGLPDHWMSYFAVDDADISAEHVVSLGGRVIRPCFDVEGVGRFAIVADATGAVFGIIQPARGQGQ